jgi:hypothetical protein
MDHRHYQLHLALSGSDICLHLLAELAPFSRHPSLTVQAKRLRELPLFREPIAQGGDRFFDQPIVLKRDLAADAHIERKLGQYKIA